VDHKFQSVVHKVICCSSMIYKLPHLAQSPYFLYNNNDLFITMTDSSADRINVIDPNLIDKIEDSIPDHTWDYVINSISHELLDCLPMQVIISIASLYLSEYYTENREEIIPDALEIIGTQNTVKLLETLELKLIPTMDELTIDKNTTNDIY